MSTLKICQVLSQEAHIQYTLLSCCGTGGLTLEARNRLLCQIEHPLLEDYTLSLEVLCLYLPNCELHPWAVPVFS